MEKAKLALNGEFTAREMEDIIVEIAKVRSGMQPPVSPDPHSAGEVMVDDQGLVIAKPLRDQTVRLWIRNSGIGWFSIHLPQGAAIALRDQLVRATDPSRLSNLISDEGSGRSGLN